MSKQASFPYPYGSDIESILKVSSDTLSAQGFSTVPLVTSPATATLVVSKNREGFSNIIGLGIECRATITVIGGNQLSVNVESEWGNKILALAIGWFFCLLPFITGIVGTFSQGSLPGKILTEIQAAIAVVNSGAVSRDYQNNTPYQAQNNFIPAGQAQPEFTPRIHVPEKAEIPAQPAPKAGTGTAGNAALQRKYSITKLGYGGECNRCGNNVDELYGFTISNKGQTKTGKLCEKCCKAMAERLKSVN